MDIEIPAHGRMTESGKSLLSLIQNNETPTLDLLIRESFQNSLDAADKNCSSKCVSIDVTTGEFRTEDIASEFSKADHALRQKFPGKQTFISIADSNTQGLTGPIRYSDVRNNSFGNFLKLVYEISKPQDQAGSGGSWGLGKTIYYRVGIGLVIFYSRISDSESGGYQERLSAVLVEDETSENPILPKMDIGRGIAWWGKKEPNYKGSKSEDEIETIPEDNPETIQRILNAFNLKRYTGEETGTTIIIPFTDNDRLLRETQTKDEEGNILSPSWTWSSVENYLRIAIQKWYAPRINNPKYFNASQNLKYLEVRINGKPLSRSKMEPFFLLVQTLYNASSGSEAEFNGKPIYSEDISLRNVFDNSDSSATAGWINYVKVDDEDLRIVSPDNKPTPFWYFGKQPDEDRNPPIICFTRKPGMIVSYEDSGNWIGDIPSTSPSEYIVGIFVANSEKHLKNSSLDLEEYLRRSERADHMSWEDWSDRTSSGNKIDLIRRIQKNCVKKIKEKFSAPLDKGVRIQDVGLGRLLAGFLLPSQGFGSSWDGGNGGGSGEGGTGGSSADDNHEGGGSGGKRSTQMKVEEGPLFENDEIRIVVLVSIGKKKSAGINVYVNTENGSISGNKWEDQIGTEFPVSITDVHLLSIRSGIRKKKVIFEGDREIQGYTEFEGFVFDYVRTGKKVASEFEITAPENGNFSLELSISYRISEEDVTASLSLEEKVEEA